MTELDLAARIARLEAIEAIKQLKARYFEHCDRNYESEAITALFARDGGFEAGKFGSHQGRDQVRAFFSTISGQLVFAAHFGMNPIIDVEDADHATGRWRLLEPTATPVDGKKEAFWLVGAYDDRYIRVGGVWLFQWMKLHINFHEPHRGSWAETAVP